MNIVMTFGDFMRYLFCGLGLLAVSIIYITYKISLWYEKRKNSKSRLEKESDE